MEEGTTGVEVADGWIKWIHGGVPDEEGKKREEVRNKLEDFKHCKKCTALSGCYFASWNMPEYPLHPHCDCELLKLGGVFYVNAYCDIRKFTEYVFTDMKTSKGKIKVFENWGYAIGNSAYLKYEFEQQAVAKYLSGEYTLGQLDGKGQRITITVTLETEQRGTVTFKTGWMVHPLGKITCSTPFTGGIK